MEWFPITVNNAGHRLLRGLSALMAGRLSFDILTVKKMKRWSPNEKMNMNQSYDERVLLKE